MSTTDVSDRFTALPDDQTLGATVVALEEHGFSVEVVDDLDAARAAVLARIPHGSSVMTNTSVTLAETGIAVHRYVLPVMAHAAATNLPASYLNVYGPAELALLALAGLVIAVAGAMLPASWAAGPRTASALRAE